MFGFNGFGGAGGMPGMDGRHYIGDGIDLGGLIAPQHRDQRVRLPARHRVQRVHARFLRCGHVPRRLRRQIPNQTLRRRADPRHVRRRQGQPALRTLRRETGLLQQGFHQRRPAGQRELKAKEALPPREGRHVHHLSFRGGGWGDPRKRDPELVRMDVKNGIVSKEAALSVYGVDIGT